MTAQLQSGDCSNNSAAETPPTTMSLVEQKKQQWAKERAEMNEWYTPWGQPKPPEKAHFVSTLDLRGHSTGDASFRQRSPSLPPLSKEFRRSRQEGPNRNLHNGKGSFKCCEDEGDTSGYASDSIPRWPERHANPGFIGEIHAQDSAGKRSYRSGQRVVDTIPTRQQNWSGESNSSVEEGRPKWGDKGIAVGKLWEPQDPTARLPQVHNPSKTKPAWVERGLNMVENGFSEVLMIDQQSTLTGDGFNDLASNSGSDSARNNFIRGQNVHVEENLKAEREARRLKALEVQNIILEQIEVREKGKREEREKRLWEERNEEMRIRRERQQDLERVEEEKRKIEEKKETERKKHQALKEAIEQAELKAKEEKENRRLYRMRVNSDEYRLDDVDRKSHRSSNSINLSDDAVSAKEELFTSESPRLKTQEEPVKSTSMPNFNMILQNPSLTDGSMSMLQIPMNSEMLPHSNNNLQYAFILPQPFGCFQQPLSIQPLVINPFVSLEPKSISEERQSRVLTPSKYRTCRDASTQTDIEEKEKIDKYCTKYTDTKLDQSSPEVDTAEEKSGSTPCKKEKKLQIEEKFKKELESRPKWGVNRPPTQYKKQSEKDLFYTQKRKLRQRARLPEKHYSSHSSDESRSPSPPRNDYNKTGLRRSLSQNHWNKQNADVLGKSNINVETINTLEMNANGKVTVGEEINDAESRGFLLESIKPSPKNRLTLSQKFINDKNGNPRMWSDNKNEEGSDISLPKPCRGEVRKKMVDRMNLITRGKQDLGDDVDVENTPSLNQMRAMRDNLRRHQSIWSQDRNNCLLDVE